MKDEEVDNKHNKHNNKNKKQKQKEVQEDEDMNDAEVEKDNAKEDKEAEEEADANSNAKDLDKKEETGIAENIDNWLPIRVEWMEWKLDPKHSITKHAKISPKDGAAKKMVHPIIKKLLTLYRLFTNIFPDGQMKTGNKMLEKEDL